MSGVRSKKEKYYLKLSWQKRKMQLIDNCKRKDNEVKV